MTTSTNNQEQEHSRQAISGCLWASAGERYASFFILLNWFVLYTRPQDLFPILGQISVPLLLTIPPMLFFLFRFNQAWTTQTKVMFSFLLFEALRILLGKFVFDDWVRNDFWALHQWKDLMMQFLGLCFPALIYLSSGQGLRAFLKANFLIGLFLSLYVIHSGGTGPGGFVGDENDVALVLLTLLPFYLVPAIEGGARFRLPSLVLSLLTLAAVVVSLSRGGFVGLLCLLGYYFLKSRRKALLLSLGMLGFIGLIPFIPSDYFSEIKSISEVNQGTAEIRMHYWKLATRIFLDPSNTLFGVGLKNTPYHLGDYETGEDLSNFPSSAGREVHSIYFQLLPDLGLWGVLIFSTLLLSFWRSTNRSQKLIAALKSRAENSKDSQLSHILQNETLFLRSLCIALNTSLIATLSAGAFISVLYYPMFWLLITLSAVLERYVQNLEQASREESATRKN